MGNSNFFYIVYRIPSFVQYNTRNFPASSAAGSFIAGMLPLKKLAVNAMADSWKETKNIMKRAVSIFSKF